MSQAPANTAEAEIARFLANAKTLEDGHLYSPEQEHDACGVGLIAAIDGQPRREVVTRGIEALQALAQGLETKVRCRVDHHGMPIVFDQKRRPRAPVAGVGRSANRA